MCCTGVCHLAARSKLVVQTQKSDGVRGQYQYETQMTSPVWSACWFEWLQHVGKVRRDPKFHITDLLKKLQLNTSCSRMVDEVAIDIQKTASQPKSIQKMCSNQNIQTRHGTGLHQSSTITFFLCSYCGFKHIYVILIQCNMLMQQQITIMNKFGAKAQTNLVC